MQNLNIASSVLVCPICQKYLSSKQNLKQHLNTHTGDKPFKCKHPGCTCEYKHASQLSCHKVLHKQKDSDPSENFGDLKTFARLLIELLGMPKTVKVKREKSIFNEDELKLPLIAAKEAEVQLPLHYELANFSQN